MDATGRRVFGGWRFTGGLVNVHDGMGNVVGGYSGGRRI